MSYGVLVAEGVEDLMRAVDRLSTQERWRLVKLVELLASAPHDVRVASQRKLRRLLSSESITHGECLEGIDRVLAAIERDLASQNSVQECLRPVVSRVASRN